MFVENGTAKNPLAPQERYIDRLTPLERHLN